MSDAPPGFPPPPAPPAKKKMSGCLIALTVLGVLVLILGAALIGGGYYFSTTPSGKAAMQAINVAASSLKGPGPDALRSAGCKEAAAIRYDKINEVVQPLVVDAGSNVEAFPNGIEVRCIDPQKPITCDDVGRIFAAADHPAIPFAAIVSNSGQDRCNVVMKPDGTPR
jgi:hypothetical protein